MAVFSLPRNLDDGRDLPVPPLVRPRLSVDGWTLAGTPLAARIPRHLLAELTTLLHSVSTGASAPWTYERAAELLEECGEPAQALAACEAWFALPAATGRANAARSRALARRRSRLRLRLRQLDGTADS